ncbi:MAG: hypothetical protein K0S08_1276 [Gammaproteobacteria bacterium]|jgi:hypothetical protein|nr:hypothetical protein [Gammaproteobacteria bacterium]
MNLHQQKKLREQLMLFLQQLHICDLKLREQIGDEILDKFTFFLREVSYKKSLKIIQNVALAYFNQALADYLLLDMSKDCHLITGARAQILSQMQSTDFLFLNEGSSPKLKIDFQSATPPEAPLEMPEQKIQFLFATPSAQGSSHA